MKNLARNLLNFFSALDIFHTITDVLNTLNILHILHDLLVLHLDDLSEEVDRPWLLYAKELRYPAPLLAGPPKMAQHLLLILELVQVPDVPELGEGHPVPPVPPLQPPLQRLALGTTLAVSFDSEVWELHLPGLHILDDTIGEGHVKGEVDEGSVGGVLHGA